MNELDWLAENRPEPPAPDTGWARAALLAHIEATEADHVTGTLAERALIAAAGDELAAGTAHANEPAARPRRALAAPRRSRRRRPPRLAAVAVLAVSALAAAVAWPTSENGTRPAVPGLPHAPEAAEAALVKLSERVAQAPDPKGDATLIVRSHHFPGGHDFMGYDLYMDDGRYYYGATRQELKQAALTTDYNDLVVKAALAARSLPADQARQKMIDATWGGKEPAAADRVAPGSPAAKLAEEKSEALGKPVPTPASEKTIDENRIWFGSTDALLAGAGRADVRAGVLLLLATIDTVKVSEANETLKLTATDYGDGYTETYYIDAKTGVAQKFLGGVADKAPDVTVTYDIERVIAANWVDAVA